MKATVGYLNEKQYETNKKQWGNGQCVLLGILDTSPSKIFIYKDSTIQCI